MEDINFIAEPHHNLYILATTDKNDRVIIKLFNAEYNKVMAGLNGNTVYKLYYSIFREDAKEFMAYYKKKLFTNTFSDGWMSVKVSNNLIKILENRDYEKYRLIYKGEEKDNCIFHYTKEQPSLRDLKMLAKAKYQEFKRIYNC